ncbi:type I-B CRISPR-associated protein Cas7/Csh2 [bacterium]|nr:type I-B CRISPR-associated protein Cas7/Csh2 [bacterium]
MDEETKKTLSSRHEFLFLYDIKMGNPNGDPDENRPRVLPDGTHYVTDVRLKRFARDFMKTQRKDILVDNIEGKTTNLTGRVVDYLQKNNRKEVNGEELVNILLDAFIDARLFGSSFAFKAEEVKGESSRKADWKPIPKTMTGAVQLNMGEVLHKAEEMDIHGTSIFASGQDKTQGTFTTYFGLRYALIGFSGVANEHSAEISRMSDDDYEYLLKAMWHGVRVCGNTRTKVGQIPHLLIDINYNQGEEFQLGRLHDYVKMVATNGKDEKAWASPEDYRLDMQKLINRLGKQKDRIEKVRYAKSPDIQFAGDLPSEWQDLDVENLKQ